MNTLRLNTIDRLRFKLALKLPGPRKSLRLERGIFSMSFDDFPRSAWTVGGPILAAHGVRGTYFVCGGLEGTYHEGLEQFHEADLEALYAAGHEVGAHTYDHVSALQATTREFVASIQRNERFLADRLPGSRRISFAYPFGDISLNSIRIVMRYFACARSVERGSNGGLVSPYALRAVGLESKRTDEPDIEELIQLAAERCQWLICFSHDVSEHPTEFGCRPRELDRALTLAKAAGLEFAPLSRVALTLEQQAQAMKAVDTRVGYRPL